MTGRPLLELRGLDVRYGGIHALQAIDLTVHEGEVVTLLGANGAGQEHHAPLRVPADRRARRPDRVRRP